MVDTARDVVDVPLSRAQNFSRARSASGKFFLLSEAIARSRRIDLEKSLKNWRNWLVSSRAARNFRQVRAVWPSNFAKKVRYHVCRKRDSNLSPPNTTWTSLSFAGFHYNRPEISRFSFIHENCFELFLSAHFLFWELLNLSDVFRLP